MNDTTSPVITAKSYLDFGGLGELRAKANQKSQAALKETAQQFEAMLIQHMLKSMRQANEVLKSDLNSSNAQEMFEGMFDQEVAVQLSRRHETGLSQMLIQHLQQPQSEQAANTQAVLAQRTSAATGFSLNPPTAQALPLGQAASTPSSALDLSRPQAFTLHRAMPLKRTEP